MFIDDHAELASGVAFNLDAVRPGPGQPLKLWALLDAPGDLVITTGLTDTTATDALITVACDGITEFELPSTAQQWIEATFAGRVAFTLAGVQTSK